MINKIIPLLLSFNLLVEAQSGNTIAVGPPQTCDLTTFTCPSITNGCCTIAGCCGTGCCALGYTCINEGTADQACCPNTDPTKCGTVSSPPPDTGTGSGSGGPKTCTQIHNCRDISTGQTWPCLNGQTCGLYYRGCNPCPYINDIGSGGGDSSSMDSSSPTDTATTNGPDATDTATGTAAPAATTKPSSGTVGQVSSWVLSVIVMSFFCIVM